jgi:hypothetical protein
MHVTGKRPVLVMNSWSCERKGKRKKKTKKKKGKEARRKERNEGWLIRRDISAKVEVTCLHGGPHEEGHVGRLRDCICSHTEARLELPCRFFLKVKHFKKYLYSYTPLLIHRKTIWEKRYWVYS